MTPTGSAPSSYSDAPRGKVPVWVWGLGACGCLPIVAVFALALLITPSLRKLRDTQKEAARTTICLSNIKQISMGFQMYAQDYDDHLPPSRGWMDSIGTHVDAGGANPDALFRCPTVQHANPAGFGYAFNNKLAGRPMSKVGAPASMQLVYDSSDLKRNASDAVSSLPNPARHITGRVRRNRTRLNVMGYLDGHVKAVSGQGSTVPGTGIDTQPGQ